MTERIAKSWGYEQVLHNGHYCAKLLVYTKPIASSLHYHQKKHETFYVATGRFEIEEAIEGAVRARKFPNCGPGFWIVLPPGVRHRVRCLEPGTIVEASSHDDPSDCVRLVPSEEA